MNDLLLSFCPSLADQISHRRYFYKSATLIREGVLNLNGQDFAGDLTMCDVEMDRRMLDWLVGCVSRTCVVVFAVVVVYVRVCVCVCVCVCGGAAVCFASRTVSEGSPTTADAARLLFARLDTEFSEIVDGSHLYTPSVGGCGGPDVPSSRVTEPFRL